MNRVITIDGVENQLKNEVCRAVAAKLGCYWVATEVFHRGIAHIVLEKNIDVENIQPILDTIFYDDWEAKIKKEGTRFLYKGKDITEDLYRPEVTNMMNQLRTIPKVQKHMLNAQRDCADLGKDLIAGGSDCGSFVFPFAVRKFYLQDEHSPVQFTSGVDTIDATQGTAEDIAEQILSRVG